MKSRMRLRVVSVFYHIIETADFVVQKYSCVRILGVRKYDETLSRVCYIPRQFKKKLIALAAIFHMRISSLGRIVNFLPSAK